VLYTKDKLTQRTLTRNGWNGIQLVPPVVRDFDLAKLVVLFPTAKPLLVGELDQVCHILLVNSVEHIEEVGSVRLTPLWHVGWHVLHEVRTFGQIWVEVSNAQLVVLGDADVLHFLKW